MGETVTIRLRDSWEDYHLIPIRSGVRSFFPPYKETFTLLIGDLNLTTSVTGRSGDSRAKQGDPKAGNYLRSGMGDIAREYPEIRGGGRITIEKLSPRKYEIVDW